MKQEKTENRKNDNRTNQSAEQARCGAERSTKSKVGSILDITVDKMRALADTGC